ncbi:response regulator [Chloroflexota bacterium]
MIKVLIADDHTIVRKGLKQVLEDTANITVAGEASNGDEVLQEISKNDYDVLLLDLTMPFKSGLEVLDQVKILKPYLNVLVLSMHPEEHYALQVLRQGASGYLTKNSAPEELIKAITKVSRGENYISAIQAEKIASEIKRAGSTPPHLTLSPREYSVMEMIASGKTATQIAKEMMLSIKTISTYRSRILIKMNMKTNSDITRYALQYQLVC